MISKAQKQAIKNAETLESFIKALPVQKLIFEEPLRIQMELFNYFREGHEATLVQIIGTENKKLIFKAGAVYKLEHRDLLVKLGWFSRVAILYFIYTKRSKKC